MKRADHHLVQQVLDGDVTQEAFSRFQQRLRAEPELLKLYEDYALLHHTLHEEFESGSATMAAPAGSGGRRFRLPWLLAVAVALTLILIAGLFLASNDRQAVEDAAVVTFSVDAVWQIEGASRSLGAATGITGGGKLHLHQGRASISFEPAVVAVLEGPAEVTIPKPNTLHLASGRGYFQSQGTASKLSVTTPRFTVADSGTAFGINVLLDGTDDLQVMEGTVRVVSIGNGESMALSAGEAARIPISGPIQRIPADVRPFAKHLGRFKPVVSGPFEKSRWRVDYGNPAITGTRIEGANYSVFLPLPEPVPGSGTSVLLATLDVGKSESGEFHTDGWAGMSFFSEGREVLFFGDSYGAGRGWSLDVKQRIPVIVPEHPVRGPAMITLRYDPRTGAVSLHEGGVPLKPAFCSGTIVPGTRFDEIRIGASAGAALAVKSIHIRVNAD